MRNFGNIALLLLLLANCFHAAHAQKHDYVWVFGDSAGVDFNGPDAPRAFPKPRPGEQFRGWGSPCVSDARGRLAFYLGFEGASRWEARSALFDGAGRRVAGGDTLNAHPQATGYFLPVPGGASSFTPSPETLFLATLRAPFRIARRSASGVTCWTRRAAGGSSGPTSCSTRGRRWRPPCRS